MEKSTTAMARVAGVGGTGGMLEGRCNPTALPAQTAGGSVADGLYQRPRITSNHLKGARGSVK